VKIRWRAWTFIAGITLALLSASAGAGTQVLELRDVQNFKVSVNENATVLTLSGLAFHSALAVEKTSTFREDSDLVVVIHLVRAHGGLSGSFSQTVAIPPHVLRVLFGTERKPIWIR